MRQPNEIYLDGNNSTVQTASAHETSKVMVYEHPLFGKVRMFVENGKTWFCGTDIATSLGYSNPRDAIVRHCKSHGVVNHDVIDSMGRIQQMKFISEGNIYRLTAKSQMPKADEFESWIFDDIVPSVINTGSYSVQPQLPNFNNPAEAARAWADQYEKNQTLALEVQQQQETIELQQQELTQSAPKVSYYDNHLQSVNALTTTQIAKEIGMSAEKLNNKLKELGIQFKQSGQWLLKSPYDKWGMHETRTNIFTSERGNTHTNTYTVWTQRGRRFIIALYENGWNVKKAIKQIKGELNPAA